MNCQEAIEAALKKFPKARAIAVRNFVSSAPADYNVNRANLALDTSLYRWNVPTQSAIRHALKLLGK